MRKNKSLVALGLLSLILAGCASIDKDKMVAVQCTFPDAPSQAAPGWICDQPVQGLEVYAVGVREKTAAGLQFQKDQATAAARVNLAQQMKTHVTNMVKQYAETTGAGSTETVDQVSTSVSKLITNETLEGSKLFKTVTSPNGTMYALVGFDPKLARKKAEDTLKTSMNNDKALWQQFKAQKGQDELAADIVKMNAAK